jgi:MFS transporter, BCD family, chlorophyll transporter
MNRRRTPLGVRVIRGWAQLGPRYLPFADVATSEMPLSRLLRLSLFQVSVGMATALMVGTLNRVMIVELGVAAWLVSLMVALPLAVAPWRVVTGHRSDTHRSAFGWRRVPFVWTGTLMQFFGLAIMPFALLVLSGQGAVPVPPWFGPAAAGLAFLVVGAGLQTAQTAGLALATDQADDHTRPRIVALMYVMLLAGMVVASIVFSALLADFSPQRLIQVVQGAAVAALALNCVALWQQEARDPARAAQLKQQQAAPPLADAWRRFVADRRARRFLWTVGLGTAAFSMQDIVLEPYGGEILRLSVSDTSALTALLAGGALVGFFTAARVLARGIEPLRMAAYGVVAGLPAFSAVIFAAPLESGLLFRIGVLAIGFGGGLFAVGTLAAAMQLQDREHTGLALGAWGAVQAGAAGVAIAAGGAIRDAVSVWAQAGQLGEVLADAATGYTVVYHLEMLLLFVTLVAVGPLVRSRGNLDPAPRKFGLADLPG